MELWEAKLEILMPHAEPADQYMLEWGLGEWSLHEDVIVGRAWIVGIFENEAAARVGCAALKAALPAEAEGDFVIRRLPDADWKNSYKEHFKAWAFGRLHWVPVWEKETFAVPAGHSVLWLDPGMAFGTGNHETTRLCIERLVEFERTLEPGKAATLKVVDAGCGSGILALSASLLGFNDVMGFDDDAEAVRVSIENAELNHLVSKVRFETAGLHIGLAPADVILANIQSDVLIRYAQALTLAVEPGGMLAMSGILSGEAKSVIGAFAAGTQGWSCESRVLGEWCDVCLRRPS
ncbi:MAG TPA: 50S ribosomal protein L11 methyltransferase [Opitutaceae bacterium]|jgi:ribosomal protein L11 methyltransferase|nr:50S ribosomal protein L11 methyltransferase [Opitutaceae bacterium]